MPKEKNFNPVAAHKKAEKANAIKKGKATVRAQRDEKLAKRNPTHIQRQIDELKAIATNGGKLSSHEESVLTGLEKQLTAVQKARKNLGDAAPVFTDSAYLGKRRRGNDGGGRIFRRWDEDSTDEDIPEEVKRIPMPRDTPPPIPKIEMDKWYVKRRERRAKEEELRRNERGEEASAVGGDAKTGDKKTDKKAKAPPPVAKRVYEAQPVVRDLVKEAVQAFTPLAVLRKMDKSKGKGGLLEPEEADELEVQGYLKAGAGALVAEMTKMHATVEDAEDDDDE